MKIELHKNFLSEDLFVELVDSVNQKIISGGDSPIFSTNIYTWQKELINSSTPILRYYLNDIDKNITSKLKKEIENKIPFYVDGMMVHLFTKLSYIPWHDDYGHKAAMTIYLNNTWDDNWGGYFMYKHNDEIRAIKPSRNLAVIQDGGIPHCVTTTNIDSDIRMTLQIFLRLDKKIL